MKKVLLFALLSVSICATAQIYPHVDGFETYPDLTVLGTQGGYSSDMTVYQSHGINSSQGVSAWMNSSNTEDSLVSPLVGPLTPLSVLSFQYRVVESVSYPNTPAVWAAGDKIEVWGRPEQSSTYYLMSTIDENNHTSGTNFSKVSLSLESGAGVNAYFKLKVKRGAVGDYFVDLDSFAVEEVIGGLVIKPSTTNAVCNGTSTGSISLVIEGGVAPYTYGWSNTVTSTPTQTNLAAGTYSVTVWDNSGRSATKTIILTEPEPVTVSTTATNLLCNGDNNGTITLTVHSGVAPFTFMWSNQAQTKDVTDLTVGTYFVIVSDAFNCTASTSQVLTEPQAIGITETHTNVTGPGTDDGSITVAATGGSGNYQYSLDGINYVSSPTFNNLSSGCYTIRVKDSNNCLFDPDPICVTELVAGVSELNSDNVTVYPNPANTYVNVRTQIVTSGEIYIVNSNGTVVLSRSIVSNETRIDVARLATGKYLLFLRTEKGNYKKPIAVIH